MTNQNADLISAVRIARLMVETIKLSDTYADALEKADNAALAASLKDLCANYRELSRETHAEYVRLTEGR